MQDHPTTDAGGWRPNKAAVLAGSHYVAAIAVVLVWLFPLVSILLTSLKNRPDIFSRTPLLFFAPTLNNYFEVASRREFVEGLVNSLKTASSDHDPGGRDRRFRRLPLVQTSIQIA